MERDMAGEFSGIRAWASKGGAQVLRIAGVLTLTENPGAGLIQRDTIVRAATLALWHLGEAARTVGTASVPAKVKHAELLSAWCWETTRDVIHSREVLRLGPSPIRTRDAFNAAIAELVQAGWAVGIEGGMRLDGRHRERVWRLRPCVALGGRTGSRHRLSVVLSQERREDHPQAASGLRQLPALPA